MEKKLFILFIFTLSLCFSEDLNSIYKKAKELEDSGDYKSAMLLYKKIANESLKNPSLGKSEDLVIKEIKKEPKKEFFEQFLNFEDENKFDSKIYLAKLLADKNQAIFLCNILENSTSYYIKLKSENI